MVRRVIGIMYKEIRGLHQAAYVLGLFAFGSQLLALVRDRLLAAEFGAGATLDIYYAAFRIPDLLYVLFASTLSVYVLIPFVTRAKEQAGAPAARALLSQVFTLFLAVYVVIALAVFAAAPLLASLLFPGISDSESLATVMRILLLQPLFLGISSLFGVVTQLAHRFVLYALSPLVYNLGIIFGIVALYPWLGLAGLAYGVVIGAIGHLLIQWPLVRQSPLGFTLTSRLDWPQLRLVLRTSLPRALTLSLNQVVLLVLFGLASIMTVGSVSVFQFAYNLQSVPLAIIGVSYSVAAFPRLAELFAAGHHKRFAAHVTTALRHIIFWSVPAIALIIVLRAQVVRVVLGAGEFDWDDTRLTAAVLAVLSLALVSLAINLLLIRALYAGGRTALPLVVSLVGSSLALILAAVFYMLHITHPGWQVTVAAFMRLSDVAGTEVLAIAFGYALAVVVQSFLLLGIVARLYRLNLRQLGRHVLVAITAAAAGGVAAYGALNFLVFGINPETFIGIFLQGFLAGIVGIVGVVLTYLALRSPELIEVYQSFQRRLLRTDVVAPEDAVL
jgi:putative peptidoglycan lipid II flippase